MGFEVQVFPYQSAVIEANVVRVGHVYKTVSPFLILVQILEQVSRKD